MQMFVVGERKRIVQRGPAVFLGCFFKYTTTNYFNREKLCGTRFSSKQKQRIFTKRCILGY